MNKNKLGIIIVLLILLITVIVIGIILYINFKDDNSNKNTNTNDQTNNENNKPNLPNYITESSEIVLPLLKSKASEWAEDYKILSFMGATTIYETEDKVYALGNDNGKFSSWTLLIYSKQKNQDIQIRWRQGELTVSDVVTTWGQSEFEADPNTRKFQNIDNYISSTQVYDIVTANGADVSNNSLNLYVGFSSGNTKYPNRDIWQVNETSLTIDDTPGDEYFSGKLLKIYYIDAISGELLEVEYKNQ